MEFKIDLKSKSLILIKKQFKKREKEKAGEK